jgi:hypothetical protein
VHPTLGILARFQAFFYASAFFQSDGVPPPAPARVTQTVGCLNSRAKMTNIHKFTRFWQIVGITSSLGLSIGLLLPLQLIGEDPFFYSVFTWLSIIMFIVTIITTFEVLTGKIITSPSGIEWVTIGTHVQIPWEIVESINVRGLGYLTLVFKESIYKNTFVKSLLHLLGSDNKIELTGYISDPLRSKLLSDIMQYAPNVRSKSDSVEEN